MVPECLKDWQCCEHPISGGISRAVYFGGDGPNVILMHELPGLTVETIDLASTIKGAGFCVHMPVLFGTPGLYQPVRNAVRLCISNEIFLFASDRTSPIVDWLRDYIARLPGLEDQSVGVIGMCLSGNFALALVAEKTIGGAAVCQPALPLFPGKADGLGMDPIDWAKVCERVKTSNFCGGILLMRFENDKLSPIKRFYRIRDGLGESCIPKPLKGKGHSTLVYERSEPAVCALLSFLEDRLKNRALRR